MSYLHEAILANEQYLFYSWKEACYCLSANKTKQ